MRLLSARPRFAVAFMSLTLSAYAQERLPPPSEPSANVLRGRVDLFASGFFRSISMTYDIDPNRVGSWQPYEANEQVQTKAWAPGAGITLDYGMHTLSFSYARSRFTFSRGDESEANRADAAQRALAYEFRFVEFRPGLFLALRAVDLDQATEWQVDRGYEALRYRWKFRHTEGGVLLLLDTERKLSYNVSLRHGPSLKEGLTGMCPASECRPVRRSPWAAAAAGHARVGYGLGWFQRRMALAVSRNDRIGVADSSREDFLETVAWTPLVYTRAGVSLLLRDRFRFDFDTFLGSLNGVPWNTNFGRTRGGGASGEVAASLAASWNANAHLSASLAADFNWTHTSAALEDYPYPETILASEVRAAFYARVSGYFEVPLQ